MSSGSPEGSGSGSGSTEQSSTYPGGSGYQGSGYPPRGGSSAYRYPYSRGYGGFSQDPFNRPRVIRLTDPCCYPPPPWCRPPPYGCPPPYGGCYPPYGGCYPPPPPPCFPPPCCPPLPGPCCPPVCGPKQVFRVPKGCRPPFLACGDGPQPLYNNCNFYTTPTFPCSAAGPCAPPCAGGDQCAPSPLPFRGPASLLHRLIRPGAAKCCKPAKQCDSSLDNFFFKDLDYLADGSSSILNMRGRGCSDISSSY